MATLMTSQVDFIPKSFQLSDGSVVSCLIYDTCGQERYNSINESYYRKADAVLLVYDITDKKSFEAIKNYYCKKIRELCKSKIPIILLGNKADRESERQIKIEEGIDLALKEKLKFKETSCLKNENVADAFEALIEMWNIENKKKKMILEMRGPIATSIKRSNTITSYKPDVTSRKRSNAITSYKIDVNKKENSKRHNSLCLYEENNDKESFKINYNENKKFKKKKCSC